MAMVKRHAPASASGTSSNRDGRCLRLVVGVLLPAAAVAYSV